VPLACRVDHGLAVVQPYVLKVTIACPQGFQTMTCTAAGIQYTNGMDTNVAQALQHAKRDFPVQKLCGVKGGAAGKLLYYVLGTDAQCGGLGHSCVT
jgi:hypothetical protein